MLVVQRPAERRGLVQPVPDVQRRAMPDQQVDDVQVARGGREVQWRQPVERSTPRVGPVVQQEPAGSGSAQVGREGEALGTHVLRVVP